MGVNNSEAMVSLLRTLRVETNGAVVEAMESRGLHYPLSYGVSLPTIKRIAAEYSPNHSLAELLYRQQVRELRLAALYIADAGVVTISQADFWAEGVINGEVAQVLAMLILSKSRDCELFVYRWLGSDDELLRYAAVMAAARVATLSWDLGVLCGLVEDCLRSENVLLRSGGELLSGRLEYLRGIE